MVVIKLQGGLGNQLFQYLAYQRLNEYYDVYFDVSDYNLPRNNGYREFRLRDFNLGIPPRLCIFSDAFTDRRRHFICRSGVKVFSVATRESLQEINVGSGNDLSDDMHEIADNSFVYGFFLNERFALDGFSNVFSFKNSIKKSVAKNQFYRSLMDSDSISVHVRLGDYLENEPYVGICTKEYYDAALSFFKDRGNYTFFFFSDDIPLCKEMFGTSPSYKYVEYPYQNEVYDLCLMSICKHNIVANSTYSWWGAWLNKNPNKIVIRPSRYQNGSDTRLFPDTWLDISNML